ncbi:DUF1902 domain-containing protein [bacterium]|nr:DUF1902 domain-containing protein [bacterium]MCI0565932.1 DUF1902 domain-containing protein [bacterium]MCI0680203.1 DUF1902 domain-containing protein [bacterium]
MKKIKTSGEKYINLTIKKLPEGYYVATSKDLQGLVAEGRTVKETLDIAENVAHEILSHRERTKFLSKSIPERWSIPLLLEV